MHNIIIVFAILLKLVRRIKKSDRLPIRDDLKQGDNFSSLLFNFAFEYAMERVEETKEGLKLNGAHQLLLYADSVNVFMGAYIL